MLRSIQQLNGTKLGTCDGDIERVNLTLNYEQFQVYVASAQEPAEQSSTHAFAAAGAAH
jgi:hypothetical protein